MSIPSICPLHERGVIEITGPDARDFLQALITNNIEQVGPDRAIYAALLTPQGKYLFDFFLVQRGDSLLLDCEAARLPALIKRLTLYRLRSKVTLRDASADFSVAAAPGSAGLAALDLPAQPGAARNREGGVIFTDPRLAEMGARLILPPGGLASKMQNSPAPAEAYHALRLELGLAEGSPDIAVEKYFLLEANFEELNGVDFRKGCYVGQELVSRMKHRSAVRKRILPVTAEGPCPASGTAIFADGREAGVMHSSLGRRGLAYLRLAALQEGARLLAGDITLTPEPPAWLAPHLTVKEHDQD